MNTPSRFHVRALVSVLAGFAFLLLAASGLVLFIAPPGRVANWTNWTILGLRKSDWGALHIWFSLMFLAGVAVHLGYNIRPLLGYFKDRVTRRIAARREWIAAAALCAVIAAGTLAKAPPFTTLITWNEALKESWEQPAERAPIPHAELLTFSALAEKGAVDVPTAEARLAARGITGFGPDTLVQTIAERANVSARQLFEFMVKPSESAGAHAAGAGGGVGWKTLAQFCAEEGIETTAAVRRLAGQGIAAEPNLPLREIASRSGGRKPYELLEIIRTR